MAGRLQSNSKCRCPLALSLSKDARPNCRWFDKLTMIGSGNTLQSSWRQWGHHLSVMDND